jgi:hypothetical protein
MESSQGGNIDENTILLQLRDFLSYSALARRQIAVLAIPTIYTGLNSGPQPGTVVGIVLGSVAGFLLLLWVIYTCFGAGIPFGSSRTVVEEEVIRRRSTASRSRSRNRHETVILEEQ